MPILREVGRGAIGLGISASEQLRMFHDGDHPARAACGALADVVAKPIGAGEHIVAATRRLAFFAICLIVCSLFVTRYSSASACEFPSGFVRSTAEANRQPQEFRVPLGPPDYRDASATKRHLVFATVLARLFTAEVERRSRGRCSIIASTSLFPDLRVTSVTGETSAGVCGDALRLNFQPKEELVSKIAWSIASVRRASPAGYMTEAGNILRETLRHVYDVASPMHALVSEVPSDLESMSASSFVEWFEEERANERTVLRPIIYCESDEEKLNARPSNGGMPYSDIIQPQTISVEMPNDRLLKSGGLSYAVLVGADSRPQNSPLRSAATEKYCGRENSFSTGLVNQFVARTDCLVEIVHNTDTWALIFCDPKTCLSEDRAKTVALAIRDDPEVVSLGKASAVNDQSRGPYLVKLTRTDN